MALMRVAAVADIPTGSGKTFQINDHVIAVFHVDGTFYALDDTCSHAQASLGEGEMDCDELTVECPRHGSQFSLETGRPRNLPAYAPVQTYAVMVQDGAVFVEYPS